MSAATEIPETNLIELRARGREESRNEGPFVNPYLIHHCERVLDRRGEAWAAAVLGRDISRRSIAVPHRPYLLPGEAHTIVDADSQEDTVHIAALDFPSPDVGR